MMTHLSNEMLSTQKIRLRRSLHSPARAEISHSETYTMSQRRLIRGNPRIQRGPLVPRRTAGSLEVQHTTSNFGVAIALQRHSLPRLLRRMTHLKPPSCLKSASVRARMVRLPKNGPRGGRGSMAGKAGWSSMDLLHLQTPLSSSTSPRCWRRERGRANSWNPAPRLLFPEGGEPSSSL
jgi:hypothetical protein